MTYSSNYANKETIFDSGDVIAGDHIKAIYDELGATPAADIAAAGSGGGATVVVKASDETVTNSTTLQNDDDFVVAIGASETWVFNYYLWVATATNADFKFAITVPTSASVVYADYSSRGSDELLEGSVVSTTGGSSRTIAVPGTAATLGYPIHIMCSVRNSTNAGNVTLQWANGTADVGWETIVRAGSYLVANEAT